MLLLSILIFILTEEFLVKCEYNCFSIISNSDISKLGFCFFKKLSIVLLSSSSIMPISIENSSKLLKSFFNLLIFSLSW